MQQGERSTETALAATCDNNEQQERAKTGTYSDQERMLQQNQQESLKVPAMPPPMAEFPHHSSVRHPQTPNHLPQLLSPPNYGPETQGSLLTCSEGAYRLLRPPFQIKLLGGRNHMRKV